MIICIKRWVLGFFSCLFSWKRGWDISRVRLHNLRFVHFFMGLFNPLNQKPEGSRLLESLPTLHPPIPSPPFPKKNKKTNTPPLLTPPKAPQRNETNVARPSFPRQSPPRRTSRRREIRPRRHHHQTARFFISYNRQRCGRRWQWRGSSR